MTRVIYKQKSATIATPTTYVCSRLVQNHGYTTIPQLDIPIEWKVSTLIIIYCQNITLAYHEFEHNKPNRQQIQHLRRKLITIMWHVDSPHPTLFFGHNNVTCFSTFQMGFRWWFGFMLGTVDGGLLKLVAAIFLVWVGLGLALGFWVGLDPLSFWVVYWAKSLKLSIWADWGP